MVKEGCFETRVVLYGLYSMATEIQPTRHAVMCMVLFERWSHHIFSSHYLSPVSPNLFSAGYDRLVEGLSSVTQYCIDSTHQRT